MSSADDIFRTELKRRGIEYSVRADERYEVQCRSRSLTVSLDNIRRNYQRDGAVDPIIGFVDQLDIDDFAAPPAWNGVRPWVRYSLEPSDYTEGFAGVLLNVLTEELNKVYVYVSPDGTRISWINGSMLQDWGVGRDELVEQSEANMAAIVGDTKLEGEEIDGVKLGMLSTEETPFKASLILSPAFRGLVAPTHGWPVYVVVPCRDFAFVLSKDDRDFLGRLGGVVVREFRRSGYSITRDVLEVSDDGIRAIGGFADSE